jgi:hypothetical protein
LGDPQNRQVRFRITNRRVPSPLKKNLEVWGYIPNLKQIFVYATLNTGLFSSRDVQVHRGRTGKVLNYSGSGLPYFKVRQSQ